MQFIDLKTQYHRIREMVGKNIEAVLEHGQYIMGPEIAELENRLAAFVGTRHACVCSSGTDALLMPLLAFDVRPGDAVFTTPFTFIATAEVISLLGATPVFVDIDPKTYNIDPDALEKAIEAVEARDAGLHPLPKGPHLTPRGIISVDLFGLPADDDRIMAVAQRFGLFVIEDAAQSFGASYKGRRAGSLGHVAATSFFPAKPLGCYGDGGAVFTDQDEMAQKLASIRVHGQGSNKYDNVRIGINGRMDTLQAGVLLAKLDIFEEEIELRNQKAAHYTRLIQAAGCEITTPHIPADCRSVFAQYSILAGNRPRLIEALKQSGIPTAIYYPKPLHLQDAFAGLGYERGSFPVAENASDAIFSLPMHPYLKTEDIERIVAVLKDGGKQDVRKKRGLAG